MGKNPSAFCKTGSSAAAVQGIDTSDFPVDGVLWDEAKSFCEKLSALATEKNAGRKYRLPTEAEWEYCCRGGPDATTKPIRFAKPADSLSFDEANFTGTPYNGGKAGKGLGRTAKVGSYKANNLGLYDMHGNLWEWCNDWYSGTVYNEKNRKDPTGPNNGSGRVLRSGSYGNSGSDCRAARRIGYGPNNRSPHVGFRVACSR
jgi:formylglycine-generating enzyme required for sulfatase activity